MINNCTFFSLITNVPLNLHKNNNNFNLCVNSSWYSIFEKKSHKIFNDNFRFNFVRKFVIL